MCIFTSSVFSLWLFCFLVCLFWVSCKLLTHHDAGFALNFVFVLEKRGRFKLSNIQFVKFGLRCNAQRWDRWHFWKWNFASLIANLNDLIRSIGHFTRMNIQTRKTHPIKNERIFHLWICAMTQKPANNNWPSHHFLLPINSRIGESIEMETVTFRHSHSLGYRNVFNLYQ